MKPLSSKRIHTATTKWGDNLYAEEDLKKSLKELQEILHTKFAITYHDKTLINNAIKEIFGGLLE